MAWIAVIIFVALTLGGGAAIAYVTGAAAVLSFVAADQARHLAILPQRVLSQLDVFTFLAMPLFILAGELMSRGGITRALIDLAMLIVGRFRGGLGHVNVASGIFMSAMSGSAVADAAATTSALVPEMRKRGYPAEYATALTAASSVLGPLIPPSIVMIFYGALMNVSVAALFAGGILPGLFVAAGLFAYNAYAARRMGLRAWAATHPEQAELVELLLAEVGGRIPEPELRARLNGIKRAPALPAVAIPAQRLVTVEADDDPLIPPFMREEVRARLKPSVSYRFATGGHFPYAARPEPYTAMLEEQLGLVPAGSTEWGEGEVRAR